MKFGFDLRMLHLITAWYSGSSAADDYGDFFFNGQYTGNNFADFLLGVPYYTYVTHTPPRNIDGKTTHFYGLRGRYVQSHSETDVGFWRQDFEDAASIRSH